MLPALDIHAFQNPIETSKDLTIPCPTHQPVIILLWAYQAYGLRHILIFW